jgi:threonyl-tRNA synthetase
MKQDIKSKEEKDLEIKRHSLAHIMAFALKRTYKNISYGVGPSNESGFYYDVLTKKPISEESLILIENEIKKIISEELPFTKKEVKIADAIKLFKELKQDFKVELLNDLKEYGTTDQNEIILIKDKKQKKGKKVSSVSLYITGKIKKDASIKDLINNQDIFIDLCKGPHIKNTKDINLESFKINKVAGAY